MISTVSSLEVYLSGKPLHTEGHLLHVPKTAGGSKSDSAIHDTTPTLSLCVVRKHMKGLQTAA